MQDPPNGGMGLTGAQRMARLEDGMRHLTEMVGELGNQVDRSIGALDRKVDREISLSETHRETYKEHIRERHAKHEAVHEDAKKRSDRLWRLVGAAAGAGGAAIYVIERFGGAG